MNINTHTQRLVNADDEKHNKKKVRVENRAPRGACGSVPSGGTESAIQERALIASGPESAEPVLEHIPGQLTR